MARSPSETVLKTLSSGHAEVYLVRRHEGQRPAAWPGDTVVCKRVETLAVLAPHNIRREIELLKRLDHPNVIRLLSAEEASHVYNLYFEYFPVCLASLLDDPTFTPSSACPAFSATARHLIRQMCLAVSSLHSQNVAHRDINPRNFVVDVQGQLKLIDLGIALEVPDLDEADASQSDPVCFDVGTGPYKAPELLFAFSKHSLKALDLWSLGASIAEFFTPIDEIQLQSQPEHDEDAMPSSSTMPPWAVTLNANLPKQGEKEYRRQHLFSDEHGEIGLAASIFKVLGTPNTETWPEAKEMPVFQNCGFVEFPGGQLASRLSELSPADTGLSHLVQSLLRISASERSTAQTASESPALQSLSQEQLEEVEQMLRVHVDRVQ